MKELKLKTEKIIPRRVSVPHPGEMLLDGYLKPMKVTQKAFAEHIGVSPVVISELCHRKRGITAKLALSLAKALGTDPEFWTHLQADYDYLEARNKLERDGELGKVEAISALVTVEA